MTHNPTHSHFGRYLTHAYLNMVHAGYQAWFTQENARLQLGYETDVAGLSPDQLAMTIDTVVPLIQLFWGGQNVWGDDGEELMPDAAQFLLQQSAELVENLKATADDVYSALHYSALSHDVTAQQVLATAHARYAYGREQYVQGLVAYGEAFKMDDVVSSWRMQLEMCQRDLAWAHHLLRQAQQGVMAEHETELLFDRTLNLPGVFRAQVQDYNLLVAQHAGEISYSALEIPMLDAEQWQAIGFAPEQAAYWQAYGVTPAEAQAWIPAGFEAPGKVVQWRDRGFSPERARELAASGEAPLHAK